MYVRRTAGLRKHAENSRKLRPRARSRRGAMFSRSSVVRATASIRISILCMQDIYIYVIEALTNEITMRYRFFL
jgi:hypothetical protein